MTSGILFGLLMTSFSWGATFVGDWIAPFGTIFIRLLKLIAIPLIFTSLVKGIADLKDISSFRHIGVRTILFYISTMAPSPSACYYQHDSSQRRVARTIEGLQAHTRGMPPLST